MKKYKCVVTTTNEYEIEIDETVHNEEWMEHYSRYFSDISNLEDAAETLAWNRSVHKNNFIEGFGYYLQNGMKPYFINEDTKVNNAINIIINSEDEEVEVDVTEIY